jgi:hypothetical protein
MSEPIDLGDTVKLADPSQGNDTGDEANMAEDSSQSATEPVAAPAAAPVKKDPKNWTSYVHLANGDVVKANSKMLTQIAANGNAYRDDNGQEHTVIGVYGKEVEFKEPEVDDE